MSASLFRNLAPVWAFLRRSTPPLDTYWQSLHYFNLYRLIVSGLFVTVFIFLGAMPVYGDQHPGMFLIVSGFYVLFSALMTLAISTRWPALNIQLNVQTLGDVIFITLLMHASGGIKSGLGLLLVVALAASRLIRKGRQAMFYAAMASIAVLLEQSYQLFVLGVQDDYFQAALLSMGFFATAGMGYYLARQVVESERLVEQKSIDLENLSQVNALVIQSMQDGVMVVDGQGLVRSHNVQWERLLGTPSRSVVGERDAAANQPGIRPKHFLVSLFSFFLGPSGIHLNLVNSEVKDRRIRALQDSLQQLENFRMQKVSVNYLDFLKVLIYILESKEPYTNGHSERVSVYSDLIAQELRLSSREKEDLQIATLLHDIGKVGLSNRLLEKTKLSEKESLDIRLNPVKGVHLIEPVAFSHTITSAIRHHHERWDGNGYPDGLAGDAIPLLARIIALADSYDAIPYPSHA